LTIDVMPTDERILGFSNRWYAPAIASAQSIEIAGARIRLVTPPYFIATKFEAFNGRGNNDYSGSHDLEDVIAVIDGRLVLRCGRVRAGLSEFIQAVENAVGTHQTLARVTSGSNPAPLLRTTLS
jgi:hypothetical protein